jgi:predicted DCC family thiol-disulfide oxidoreductase YuxK
MSSNKSHDDSSRNKSQDSSLCTVYFDGMCPVCSREISAYRQLRGGDAINWVDASRCDLVELSAGLDRAYALQRLHVQTASGTLLSGAAAFIEIWKHLPAFAWMARLCSNRYVLAVLDVAYGRFLVMRRLWRKR